MISVNRRKAISFLLAFLSVVLSNAQKTDYIWLTGYSSNVVIDSTIYGYKLGNTKLNFSDTPVQVAYDSLGMNFEYTNTTICDTNGNLLFYTNGISVSNDLDETIENGDSLGAGYVIYVWNPLLAQYGGRSEQGIIALPDVSNPNRYYLFHSFDDTVPGTNGGGIYCSKTLVTLVNMSANSGRGQVIYKNLTLIHDTLGDEIQAVRHGNGRDWWLLVQKRNTNCYYRILLDSSGPSVKSDLACLGSLTPNEYIGAECFSPDGSKFVYLSGYSGLNIYDFDRCTGMLSNELNFPLPVIADSNWVGYGVGVSSNSRFLYVSLTHQIYQFDLWGQNIFSTIDTIGVYNGSYLIGEPALQNAFHMQQIAPDGKIYISCGNTTKVLHVINNPDEPDSACNFLQDGLALPALGNSIPNYPNYRLGSLTQSQCDTLAELSVVERAAKEQIIKVFPNPATDYTIVDYGFTDWNNSQPNLEICDALGQTAFMQLLPMYSGFQKVDLTNFAAGIYTVYIKRANVVVAKQKLVVQH